MAGVHVQPLAQKELDAAHPAQVLRSIGVGLIGRQAAVRAHAPGECPHVAETLVARNEVVQQPIQPLDGQRGDEEISVLGRVVLELDRRYPLAVAMERFDTQPSAKLEGFRKPPFEVGDPGIEPDVVRRTGQHAIRLPVEANELPEDAQSDVADRLGRRLAALSRHQRPRQAVREIPVILFGAIQRSDERPPPNRFVLRFPTGATAGGDLPNFLGEDLQILTREEAFREHAIGEADEALEIRDLRRRHRSDADLRPPDETEQLLRGGPKGVIDRPPTAGLDSLERVVEVLVETREEVEPVLDRRLERQLSTALRLRGATKAARLSTGEGAPFEDPNLEAPL